MRKAFTLIEMVIVIILLGILAATVVPNQSSYITQAQKVSISSTLRTIQNNVALIQVELLQSSSTTLTGGSVSQTFPLTSATDALCLNAFKALSGLESATTGNSTSQLWGVSGDDANGLCTFATPSVDPQSWSYNTQSHDFTKIN